MRASEICPFLYDLARRESGRNVTVEMDGKPVIFVQRVEDMHHLLRTNEQNYRKNNVWLKAVLGPSRLSEDGAAWRTRLAVTHDHFHRFDRDLASTIANEEAVRWLERLAHAGEAGLMHIPDDEFRRLTSTVLVRTFLGIDPSESGVDWPALGEILDLAGEISYRPPGSAAVMSAEEKAELIRLKRKVAASFSTIRSLSTERRALLESWLRAEQRPEDPVFLEHELTAFFLAGSETVASTLGWCVWVLATNPELQSQLAGLCREENDADCTPTLRNFVSEVLRLYPPSPILSRIALAPDTLSDHEVATGQIVMISVIGVQTDTRLRDDPWAIDIVGHPTKPAPGHATAFSAGNRMCGGKSFALAELTTFLRVFLRQARFEPTSAEEPRMLWKAQMVREGGQPVRAVIERQ